MPEAFYNMQRSSPLAAMQPATLPFAQFGCRGEAHPTYSDFGGQCQRNLAYGSSSFNFKDLSMARAPLDYFSLKPVRGSSPTASLAADLSQNFHIDRRYIGSRLPQDSSSNANPFQPTTGHPPSVSFLVESLWDAQWPG